MKKFQSVNPYNNEIIEEFDALSESAVIRKLELSKKAFEMWRVTSFEERALLLTKVSNLLRANTDKYARSISLEMGKPLKESLGEVEKCALVCEYYAEHGMAFLKEETFETDANSSYVKYQPIGTVFAIMPWNFPFWQVFRFAAPSIMAGNVGLLKHAPNVFRCATHIEEIFLEAGFPEGVFQSVIVDVDLVETIISHSAVKAITLTGSEKAGSSVAALAGKNIKKSVLELGGSNGFVVLDDADLKRAVQIGLLARMQNSGQSCIAA
jgi:succinate-semialdehyde dehydrogenase/glutarate-semialdehyde dehydrogenase